MMPTLIAAGSVVGGLTLSNLAVNAIPAEYKDNGMVPVAAKVGVGLLGAMLLYGITKKKTIAVTFGAGGVAAGIAQAINMAQKARAGSSAPQLPPAATQPAGSTSLVSRIMSQLPGGLRISGYSDDNDMIETPLLNGLAN